ncbi:uncharacterized protein LOC105843664 isoform X4 [Hydra vulgaris]|uniref:Uncharacterized protein LOC105843664 isoform X4 n=1 Tax=Hydra vulgaris TaxID=6087 RepID=A0ABM4CIF2_HYDVU
MSSKFFVLRCFILIGCLKNITSEYNYPVMESSSRYSYTVYKDRKVNDITSIVEAHANYNECITACYNKKNCKSIDAEIIDKNLLRCRFFDNESTQTIQSEGFIYVSSKPPNCSRSCSLTPNPCGNCSCIPSCAARNRRQHVCNCTIAAGIARSCQEHYDNGFTKTAVYQISPYGFSFETVCEMAKLEKENPKEIFLKTNEQPLTKNNLIARLPWLENAYSISFKFKPRSYSHGAKNVIHLTLGNDLLQYGDRNPGVWFSAPGTLQIFSPVNGYRDYITLINSLPLNTWSSIRISQIRVAGVYTYSVNFNGNIIKSVENTLPQSFQNPFLFAADPWYDSADGFIKDFRIINDGSVEKCNGHINFLDQVKDRLLVFNNMITTLPWLEKTFSISFKLKPESYPSTSGNVIHLTTSGNYGQYGERCPSIWYRNDGYLIISTAIGGNGDFYMPPQILPLNVWSSIRLSQTQVNGVYTLFLLLNGTIIFSIVNTYPQSFRNVRVYAADPWHSVQNGFIKEFTIINGYNNFVEELNEHELNKDKLIARLSTIEKEYLISFKIKPRLYSNDWKNVIHLTIGQNSGQSGVFAVWFYNDSSGSLYISSAVNGNNDYAVKTQPLPLNQWSFIKVSQYEINRVYTYAIHLNEIIIHTIENKIPQSFKNIDVYTADPWHDAQNGSIKDLKIINGNIGIWIPMMTRFSTWESSFWDKSYEAYENGFGLINQQWIGLKNINQITSTFFTDMRVEYFIFEDISFSSMYYNVTVSSSIDDYLFSYETYDSKGSLEPDLFDANNTTFKSCSNWWTTSCIEATPTSTNYISYGSSENLFSIQFFLRTNGPKK